MSGHGVLGAVAASVRVAPGSTPDQIAARIRPVGRVSVVDVDHALASLAMLAVVQEDPAGCWRPGRMVLEELPVSVAELEETFHRSRGKRRHRAHRHR